MFKKNIANVIILHDTFLQCIYMNYMHGKIFTNIFILNNDIV